MTEKNEKPSIEQQVAEWSATDAALHEAVKATDGLTIAGHVDGPKAGYRAVEAERKAEAARLEAEREAERAKERAERERLEKAAQRMRELAAVGSLLTLDECAAMDDATFAAALASATASHAEAQRKADEIRQENARLQREADARAEADRAEAQRKEREAQEEADRVKREAEEAEARRLEEEARPSIDKAHAWLDSILDAIAAVPTVESDTVRRDIARAASVLRETVEEERQAIMPY